MGFLKSLLGKQKEPVKETREMAGQVYRFEDIEVLVLNHVVEDDRRPFTEKKETTIFCAICKRVFHL